MEIGEYIKCRGGRTGREIHYARKGSSASLCGHWFKASVNYFKVLGSTPVTCERCKAYAGIEKWVKK